jgi:hypothetical protein
MAFENVDIYFKDNDGDPIPGIVVRVYSKDGKTFYTQGSTNVDGLAAFLLNTQEYQLRFYKQHVGLPNPRYIEVLEGQSNVFDLLGELITPPSAIDPRLCTAYGYFRRPDGTPAAHVDVHFIAKFKPLLLEGSAVVTERTTTRTDKDGYMQINLIRCGQYDVTVQGIEDEQRLISVPDAANVSLPALLFPVVDSITFDPPGPWTVAAGQEIQVTPTIHGSDGNELDDFDVIWSSSDSDVLAVLPAGGVLTLRGLSAGTASVEATRADQSIVRIPDTPIEGVPAVVTVT